MDVGREVGVSKTVSCSGLAHMLYTEEPKSMPRSHTRVDNEVWPAMTGGGLHGVSTKVIKQK